MDAGESDAYLDLQERSARLDERKTRYRFDLEQDIPWDSLEAGPGVYFPPDLLGRFGIDAARLARDPEGHALFDWAAALGTFGVISTPLWQEGQSMAVRILIGVFAGLVMAVVMALITGLVMRALLTERASARRAA